MVVNFFFLISSYIRRYLIYFCTINFSMIDYDSPPLMGNGRTTTSVEETPIGTKNFYLKIKNYSNYGTYKLF